MFETRASYTQTATISPQTLSENVSRDGQKVWVTEDNPEDKRISFHFSPTFLIMSHVIIPLPVFSIKQVCVTILLNR